MIFENLSPRKQKKLLEVLTYYNRRDILYPGVVIRHTALTMKDAYAFLDELEDLGIIHKAYEIHCPKCQKYTGEIYDSLNDIPNEFFCEECENNFIFPNGILVVYRVISE